MLTELSFLIYGNSIGMFIIVFLTYSFLSVHRSGDLKRLHSESLIMHFFFFLNNFGEQQLNRQL